MTIAKWVALPQGHLEILAAELSRQELRAWGEV